MSDKVSGNEKFVYYEKELGFDILEFWRYKFSEIYDLQSEIAEFIVEKALGLKESQNTQYWTLYDFKYREKRIEVKETSYFHAWDKPKKKRSQQRVFSIGKAYTKYKDSTSVKVRQNDIYVFCLNTGYDREEAYPLNINNWEFYVIPTNVINENCGDNKTIGLGRVRELAGKCTPYSELKNTIDKLIENNQV